MNKFVQPEIVDGRTAALIELSSSFLLAILTKNYSNDPKIWNDLAKFKNELYDNLENGITLAHSSDGDKILTPLVSSGGIASLSHDPTRKSHSNTKKTHSINTLVYTKVKSVDDQVNEDPTFNNFASNGKRLECNFVTEVLPTLNLLQLKLDVAAIQALKVQIDGFEDNFGGARFIVPSKSSFYRVIAFGYIENLLLAKINQSQIILRTLIQVVYQGEIVLKGPSSSNSSNSLRNKFCGYLSELYRQSLADKKSAVAIFYKMINQDSVFDQCLVSLVKEIIIECLNEKEFIESNLKNFTESEIQKLIETVKNSSEITETIIELTSTIFQLTLSSYLAIGKTLKENNYTPKSDGTSRSFTMAIISQNYRGCLNYFIIHTKEEDSSTSTIPASSYYKPFTDAKDYMRTTRVSLLDKKHAGERTSSNTVNISSYRKTQAVINNASFQLIETSPLMIRNEMLKGDEPLSEEAETYNFLDCSKNKHRSNSLKSDPAIIVAP